MKDVGALERDFDIESLAGLSRRRLTTHSTAQPYPPELISLTEAASPASKKKVDRNLKVLSI